MHAQSDIITQAEPRLDLHKENTFSCVNQIELSLNLGKTGGESRWKSVV